MTLRISMAENSGGPVINPDEERAYTNGCKYSLGLLYIAYVSSDPDLNPCWGLNTDTPWIPPPRTRHFR